MPCLLSKLSRVQVAKIYANISSAERLCQGREVVIELLPGTEMPVQVCLCSLELHSILMFRGSGASHALRFRLSYGRFSSHGDIAKGNQSST